MLVSVLAKAWTHESCSLSSLAVHVLVLVRSAIATELSCVCLLLISITLHGQVIVLLMMTCKLQTISYLMCRKNTIEVHVILLFDV